MIVASKLKSFCPFFYPFSHHLFKHQYLTPFSLSFFLENSEHSSSTLTQFHAKVQGSLQLATDKGTEYFYETKDRILVMDATLKSNLLGAPQTAANEYEIYLKKRETKITIIIEQWLTDNNKSYKVSVYDNVLCGGFLHKIAAHCGVERARLNFIHKNSKLSDDATFRDYNITNDSIIGVAMH